MRDWIGAHFWLIPALPLAGSLVILTLGRTRRRTAALLAIAGQSLALILAATAFLQTLDIRDYRAVQNFVWFTFGDQALRIGWILDPLAAAMLVMITLVGLCIFIFSVGYMAGDKDFTRFFAYLSFFSAAMLGLVLANSLLLLFVWWELVGLASYLLIGFWIDRPSAAAAAKKAFITTRIGDLGLFLGMLWLYNISGTLLFYDNGRGCIENTAVAGLGASATAIALLIFCGAAGKSGQVPLHVWLPDAMEGPTPVSALIHAATMVAAGVFLVARVYPLFTAGAVNGTTPSLTIVVSIGIITGLLASLIALGQFDIKRILAYSTISQLGLMMVSLGVGGVAAGIMHLIVHGFFKALLFLGGGSVIHGTGNEQDIRKMGALRWAMPVTFLTYAVGMLNLSGAPFFFAGGWSKEEILHATARWQLSQLPYYFTLLGVVLTALYMTRQMIYVFLGKSRVASGRAHESPRVMTVPLLVLAACSVCLSFVLTPAWPWFQSYLEGESVHRDVVSLLQPTLLFSLLLVGGGIVLGVFFYRCAGASDPLERVQPGSFRLLENRFWIDELYDRTVVALSWTAARLSDRLDYYIWDGAVRCAAALGQLFGMFSANFDEHGINTVVDESTVRARGLGSELSRWHSGQIQAYLGCIAIGMLCLLILYAWLG